jgi:hypothetical protein
VAARSERARVKKRLFSRVLVANRGEIALRIIRACQEMGIQTVAVCSEADRAAQYLRLADQVVCIGQPPASQSYLRADRIIAARKSPDVDRFIRQGFWRKRGPSPSSPCQRHAFHRDLAARHPDASAKAAARKRPRRSIGSSPAATASSKTRNRGRPFGRGDRLSRHDQGRPRAVAAGACAVAPQRRAADPTPQRRVRGRTAFRQPPLHREADRAGPTSGANLADQHATASISSNATAAAAPSPEMVEESPSPRKTKDRARHL